MAVSPSNGGISSISHQTHALDRVDARAIEPFGIHWIEEPLPPGDFRGYAELRARSPIALAAGEAHHTVRDFRALIDGRCIDIVQPA